MGGAGEQETENQAFAGEGRERGRGIEAGEGLILGFLLPGATQEVPS